MKHEWKKADKALYLPPNQPQTISVPELSFFTIEGHGNPNDDFFTEYVGVLYSLAYAIKMSPKQNLAPADYFEYTVYPLEGIWWTDQPIDQKPLDKNRLSFKLMIRQPTFASKDFADEIIDRTKKKKPHDLLDKVKFETITEGLCVQMLHLGSYDDEPASFALMEQYAAAQNLRRVSLEHREIYLSDARKVAADKLKTVLRFQVEQI